MPWPRYGVTSGVRVKAASPACAAAMTQKYRVRRLIVIFLKINARLWIEVPARCDNGSMRRVALAFFLFLTAALAANVKLSLKDGTFKLDIGGQSRRQEQKEGKRHPPHA